MKSLKMWRHAAGAVMVLSIAAAAALVGGAGTGRAATGFDFTFQSAVNTGTNSVPTVSLGGKIGSHLEVTNGGDSTTTQVQIFVKSEKINGADALATFFDASDGTCVGVGTTQMTCTPFGGTMKPGDTFKTDFRFLAPTSGQKVSLTAYVVVAAQSVGGKKNGNNGTILATSDTLTTTLATDTTTQANTFLRGNGHCSSPSTPCEIASTGALKATTHAQNFSLQTPDTLFGSFAIAVAIQDFSNVTPLCGTCLPSYTALNIPLAHFVTPTESTYPFFDGTNFTPYVWTMNAIYPAGFQLNGIYHFEDNTSTPDFVPNCASTLVGGAPSAAYPLCYDDTITQNKGAKTLSAHGRGLENGNITFG